MLDRTIDDGPIFVFGSNTSGAHGAGSALAAHKQYGAQLGIGNGITGQSYGVPTCAYNKKPPVITPLPKSDVEQYVQEFVRYAQDHPELIFMMTKIGTGVAGFTEEEMCEMLVGAPKNVDMPMDWCQRMGRKPTRMSLWEALYPKDAITLEKYKIEPTETGFSLWGNNQPHYFNWNQDRSRIQNVSDALRYGMGIAAARTQPYDPDYDGDNHLNIYSKGKTKIGRFLSNFMPVEIDTEDGKFFSVEGYWYWLTTPPETEGREELRELAGFAAKQLGRKLRAADWRSDAVFVRKIIAAIETKLLSSPEACDALAETGDLPIVHYYNYEGNIVQPKEGRWMLDWIHVLRARLQEGNK